MHTVPQTFPYSQPIVSVYGQTQAELEAGVAKIYDQLNQRPHGDWNGAGWVREGQGDYSYMIQCPAPPPQPPITPQPAISVAETRSARHKRIAALRAEAMSKAPAHPKPVRERPSKPEGYVDKRTVQRQKVAERNERKKEMRRMNSNNPPRLTEENLWRHEAQNSNRTVPAPNVTMTRDRFRRIQEERAANAAALAAAAAAAQGGAGQNAGVPPGSQNGLFYSESVSSWEHEKPDEVAGWREGIRTPPDGDAEMSDAPTIEDLGLYSGETLDPDDAIDG